MIPKYHINLFWSEPDNAWVADVPDLQPCSAFGDPPAEALAEIEQAIEAWLAVAREDGLPIPESRYRALTRGMDGCRYLVHVAALYSFSPADRRSIAATNVQGTASILEAARIAGIERVGRNDRRQSPARVSLRRVHHLLGALERAASLRNVPAILQLMAILGVPVGRRQAGGGKEDDGGDADRNRRPILGRGRLEDRSYSGARYGFRCARLHRATREAHIPQSVAPRR